MDDKTKVIVHTEKATLTPKNLDDPVKILYPQVILGIHADKEASIVPKNFHKEWYYNKNCQFKECSIEQYSEINDPWIWDGHIWITVKRNDDLKTYSLWKDGYESKNKKIRIENNGPGTDIREDIDKINTPKGIGIINRYYLLSIEQENLLHKLLNNNITYEYPNYQCATWTADIVESVAGENLHPQDGYYLEKTLGILTPRMVASMIKHYESTDKTDKTVGEAKIRTKPRLN